MKIILENYGMRYTVEDTTGREDYSSNELKDLFSRLLIPAGFSPDNIDCDEGGRYEYVEEDEVVVKKEIIEIGETNG